MFLEVTSQVRVSLYDIFLIKVNYSLFLILLILKHIDQYIIHIIIFNYEYVTFKNLL